MSSPSPQYVEALRWILSESGQLVRIDSSASTFIRSLEGGEWCVGTLDPDDSISDEKCYSDVKLAIDDYVSRVTELDNFS